MRFGGNFHPDWGYLAPAPDVMRTARIVAVATAIGATAGAAVVLSLVDRPIPGPVADASKTLVVVHSLVLPAEAAAPAAPAAQPVAAAAVTAQSPPQAQASVTPSPTASFGAPATSEAHAVSTPTAPASVAALAESPPATEAAASGGDAVTIDTSAAANPAGGPKAAMAAATKKLPGAPGTPAAGSPQQAQHGPAATPPRRKTAGNDGLGPILRRLFSAN